MLGEKYLGTSIKELFFLPSIGLFFLLLLVHCTARAFWVSVKQPIGDHTTVRLDGIDFYENTQLREQTGQGELNTGLTLGTDVIGGYSYEYSYQPMHLVHRGRVGKYECAFFGCGWVGTNLIAGFDTSEKIDFSFNRHSLSIVKPLNLNHGMLQLVAGLDVIDASATATSLDFSKLYKGLIPLVRIGFRSRYDVREKISVGLSGGYAAIRIGKGQFALGEGVVDIEFKIARNILVSIGLESTSLVAGYQDFDKRIKWQGQILTPFVQIKSTWP